MGYDDIYDDDMFDKKDSEMMAIKSAIDAVVRERLSDASTAKSMYYNPDVIVRATRLKKWFEKNFKDEIEIEFETDFLTNTLCLDITFFEVWETDGPKSKEEFVSHFDGVQNFSITTKTNGYTTMSFQYPNFAIFEKSN